MGALNDPITQGVMIGADIGQPNGGDHHYVIRHIDRLPLGTPYPAVCERLGAIYGGLRDRDYDPLLYVDATGVGTPVVDLLRAANLPATAVYLTGGDNETHTGNEIRLPKTLMVSRLQVLLQSQRIHLPETPIARALTDELLNYEIRVTESANLQMGVFKTGAHDDMATALGLACRPFAGRLILFEFSL